MNKALEAFVVTTALDLGIHPTERVIEFAEKMMAKGGSLGTLLPPGWTVVPEDPTPKMVDSTWYDDLDNMSHNKRNRHIWTAMIAAAPKLAGEDGRE